MPRYDAGSIQRSSDALSRPTWQKPEVKCGTLDQSQVYNRQLQKYIGLAQALRDPSLMNDAQKLNMEVQKMKLSRWYLAIALMSALWQQGMEYAPARDYHETSSILVGCFRLSMQWEQGMLLAESFQLGNDSETLCATSGTCSLARQWSQALAGLSSLRNAGLEVTNDTVRRTFTCPDDAWLESLKFLRLLRRTVLRPSTLEFSKVLSFSAQASWPYSLYFLSLARTEAVVLDDSTGSACFSAFCRRFRPWQYACSLLSDFKHWAVVLQRSSFNSLLGVFHQRPSLWKQVLSFVPSDHSFQPDLGHVEAFRMARARRAAEAIRSRRANDSASEALAQVVELGLETSSIEELQAALKAYKDSSEWDMALRISQRLAELVRGLL